MITPNKTLQFYAENARQYAERPPDKSFINRRNTFAAHFEQGKHVLELGCGAGHDALAFMKLGLSVTLVDGSLELAAIAQECTGQEVLVMDFRELAFEKQFDGIWAAASLLHVPSPALPDVFNRIARSLRPGGYFTASFKESDVDWRDELGRTFCAMNAKKLEKYATDAGLNPLSIDRENGFGSDKQPTQWLWVTAQAV